MRILRDFSTGTWGCARGVPEVDWEGDEEHWGGEGEFAGCGDQGHTGEDKVEEIWF